MSVRRWIVLQKSKIERRRNSRKSGFLAGATTAILRSAHAKLRGRFLCETMWSLILPRAKGISGPENFWSAPQKDFFNTIQC
jgi:hypothetical protein